MIVPKYWASGKRLHKQSKPRRQVTIQRWGWSDISQALAQDHADTRAQQALDEFLAKKPTSYFSRQEPKVPYNGAEGVPIREEIVLEKNPDVITRNGYGALCLNTPDVLFVDIDNDDASRLPAGTKKVLLWLILGCLALWTIWWWQGHFNASANSLFASVCPPTRRGAFLFLLAGWIGIPVLLSFLGTRLWRGYITFLGGALGVTRKLLQARVRANPQEHWRIYQTPAGLRLLALHATFDPTSSATQVLMKSLNTDQLYTDMCRRQNCFRARVSPKPWRMNNMERLRGAVWPVALEKMPSRLEWVHNYTIQSDNYAACRFVEAVGNTNQSVWRTQDVMRWHDQFCQVNTTKQLA